MVWNDQLVPLKRVDIFSHSKEELRSSFYLAMAYCLEITDDTLLGMKLNTLLINRGTAALRRIFDRYVPPPQLLKFLNRKKPDIRKLNREGKINKSQWDKLYPAPAVGTPASKHFDISLLYVLLRNVCGMPAPATGWAAKPPSTDNTAQAAVKMIHWYRNHYSHATIVEIDEASFQSSWKEIADAVQRLGEDASRVENLRAAPLSASICIERLAKFDFSGEVHFYASKYHPGTRKWVFSHVESWFQNRMSDSRVLIITGNAGMGKSVIAAQLCHNMKERSVLGGMHFCQHNNQRRRKPELMVQSLARHLCDNLPGFKDVLTGQLACLNTTDLTNMNMEELFTHVLQETTNMMADPGMNILLVVDAVDECEHQGRNELFDMIRTQFHKLPSWIKFVITGRTGQAMIDKLDHFNPFVLHPSDEKNEKDIELFFEESLRRLLPNTSIEQNVSRFVSQAEGLMLYAHFVIKHVEDHKSTLTPSNLSDVFPRGITSVYEQYIDRLQKDLGVGKERFFDFLSSLAAARSPLPATMAWRILGLCYDIEDGWSQFQKMSASISRLLPIHDGCIDVFHKSIVDWLCHPELYGQHKFTVKITRGNVVLLKECERTYNSIKQRQDVPVEYSQEERYALQHGTHHFTALPKLDESQKNRLFRHACSLELLFAQLQSKACDVFSLIEELQSIKPVLKLSGDDSKEVDDCITCLRRHPYLLMENPNMIFQLLVNEAESTAISLEACSVMYQTKYQLPLRLEVVNRSQTTDPVITKFRCKTRVNCCDILNQAEHTLLVCGCAEGFVHLFSVETGRELWSCRSDVVIDIWPTEEERCNYCFFVPQHGVVVHGRFDKAVTFDGGSKELFPENEHTFIDACISLDRKTMVTRETHVTNNLMIWELDKGELVIKLEPPTGGITCCAISSCEQYVISGSFDRGVSLWNMNVHDYTYQQNAFSNEEPLTVDCLSGSEGNSQFVLLNSSKKQLLTFCELLTNEFECSELREINLGSTHRSLGVSNRGDCLYVCGESRQLHCPGLPFAIRIAPISKRTRWTYAKEVDTERVLLKDFDTVYMCRTLENKSSVEMADCGVRAISFSANGQHLYVLCKVGMSVYEASSGRWLRGNRSIHANSFALSPNDKSILFQREACFELWNSDLQQRVKSLEHPITPQRFFSYLDNDLVLFVSRSGHIQIWNLDESTFRDINGPKQSMIECCDIFVFEQKDGVSHYRLLCCDRQRGLMLYDTVKVHHIQRSVPEEEIVKCCKFSFDGRCIATGHIDGSLQLWDGQHLDLKKRLGCGDNLLKGCGYLEQDFGDAVATVSESGTLRIWDAFSRAQLGSMKFESNIHGLVASPVKAQVCIALEDKFVIVNVHRLEFD